MTYSDEPALPPEPPEVADAEQPDEPLADDPTPVVVVPDVDWVDLPGSESLDLTDATAVAAHVGSTVILVAGKNYSGKTTLLVQIYAQFLNGPFAGLEFAGSETLDAFDERHFGGRAVSGNEGEEMDHTEDVDMRFLHLRLADSTEHQRALMPTDLVGELFNDIRDGVRVDERVPIARRADKVLFVVDGAEVKELGQRQVAERDAHLTLAGLTEPGGVSPDTPVMFVLTKADLLDDEHVAWFETCAERLIKSAREERGMTAVIAHVVAARPRDASKPRGLKEVVEWMWDRESAGPLTAAPPPPPATRAFLTAAVIAR